MVNFMNPSLVAFFGELAAKCRLIDECIQNGDYDPVYRYIHDVLILHDCIQRTIDGDFVSAIVKSVAVDVAADTAKTYHLGSE